MKKIIAILAVIALMTAMMIAVSATGEPTIVVNPATVENGQVRVEISIKNNPGITNGKARFTYDSALTLKSIEAGAGITGAPNVEKNLISFASTGTSGDMVLFTLTFDVAADADCGDYNVEVTFDKLKAGSADLTSSVVIENGVATVEHHYVKTGETVGTCSVPGTITYTCSDCGDSYTEEGAFGPHSLVHVEAVAPGCHMTGNIEHWYCTECGLVWQDAALTQITNHMNVILPATGGNVVHVEAVAPGCHMTGNIEHWYCTECDTVWADAALTQITNHMNVILPALGGEVVHVEAVAPGCHMTGNIEHWYCTECGQVWQDAALTQLTNHMNVILPALGGEVVHVEAVAPGCHMTGNIEHWYCLSCGQVWQDAALTQLTNHMNVILPALGGEVVHIEAVAPGCHMTGNIEHWYCLSCGQVWQDAALTQLTNHMNVILPALGGEVIHVGAKAPTCTENGNIEHWYCETCEQVWQDAALTQLTNHKNVILGALGHEFSEEYACDETGHWHKCIRCDCITEVEAHTMEDVIITEPGKYTEGVKIQVCSICGWTDNKDIIIPPTGDTSNVLVAVIGAFSSVAAAAYVTMKRK